MERGARLCYKVSWALWFERRAGVGAGHRKSILASNIKQWLWLLCFGVPRLGPLFLLHPLTKNK